MRAKTRVRAAVAAALRSSSRGFELGHHAVHVGDAERPPHPVVRRDVDLLPDRVGDG
jgi:hypothetical protein